MSKQICRVENVLKHLRVYSAKHARTYTIGTAFIIHECLVVVTNKQFSKHKTTHRYSSEASYYHGYYSTYYSDWYANYYADYYAQAVRNVDKMKYGENMNQLKSEENKPPKQVVGGVLGSLKGALGAIIP